MGAPLSRPPAIAAGRAATRVERVFYGTVRAIARVVVRLLFRLKVENAPRIPGPYVVVANHGSFLDPVVIGCALPRHAIFLMTIGHFRSPLLGWFYRWMRCIPLALRGSNREPLRVARGALGRGEVLAMFPEGGISRDGEMLCGSPGAVSLVLGEDVPIVAAHIEGASRVMPSVGWPRPGRVRVRFADPIRLGELLDGGGTPDRRAHLRLATRRIMDRIAGAGGVCSREAWLEARRRA